MVLHEGAFRARDAPSSTAGRPWEYSVPARLRGMRTNTSTVSGLRRSGEDGYTVGSLHGVTVSA